jgi:hypothetical protein
MRLDECCSVLLSITFLLAFGLPSAIARCKKFWTIKTIKRRRDETILGPRGGVVHGRLRDGQRFKSTLTRATTTINQQPALLLVHTVTVAPSTMTAIQSSQAVVIVLARSGRRFAFGGQVGRIA